MGRKTFDSIGKPLPRRTNVVITRQKNWNFLGVTTAASLQGALGLFASGDEEVFVLGGGEIFKESMKLADRIYLTIIHQNFEGDTFFPEVDESVFEVVHREDYSDPYPFSFIDYKKK